MKLLIFLLFMIPTYAKISSNTINISGNVSIIETINISKTSDSTYWIHEFSNNPNGYTVILHTDETNIKYNGLNLTSNNDIIILTQVTYQYKTVDILKKLIFPNYARPFKIEIRSN